MEDENNALWQAWAIGGTEITGKKPSEIVTLNEEYRNPILIVSEPLSMENTILDLFSISATAKNTNGLKQQVKQQIGTDFANKITRDMLEKSSNKVITTLVKIFKEMENI